jgi:hypothetical protein
MIILPRVRTVIRERSWSAQSDVDSLHSLLSWVGGACYGRFLAALDAANH